MKVSKTMKSKKGFTLVEILVYASILAITAGLLTAVLTNTLRIRNREANSTELAQQLNFVMNNIQSLINESSVIDAVYATNEADIDDQSSPCTDLTDFCTVKLRFAGDALDPTWVQATAGGINLVRGDDSENDGSLDNATTSQLTGSNITVDHLRFTKFVFEGGHDSLRIDMAFTINDGNPQFAVTRSIQSAVGRATAAIFGDHLLPNADDTFDVGQVTGSKRWRDAAFSRNVTIGGNVGIGTAAPGYKLDVAGTI
ncbi:MAG: type II secretion system protein, partial [Candidatus Colwellbacteria bacterium]